MSTDLEREREFVAEHKRKSKHVGDYHWRKAHMYTGEGDFVFGADDGEPPQGAYQSQN